MINEANRASSACHHHRRHPVETDRPLSGRASGSLARWSNLSDPTTTLLRRPSYDGFPPPAIPPPPPTQPPRGHWRPFPYNGHLSRFSTDSDPAASNPQPSHDHTQTARRGLFGALPLTRLQPRVCPIPTRHLAPSCPVLAPSIAASHGSNGRDHTKNEPIAPLGLRRLAPRVRLP